MHPASRAIEVALDPAHGTATLVRSYSHPTPLVADSQGNVQALANGDWMIGWGQAGYFSEVEPSGRLLFDAHLPSGWESYRAYVLPWSARPAAAPSLALRRGPFGGVRRLRELERGHRGGLLEGAGRRLPARAGAAGERPPSRALRRASRCRCGRRRALLEVQALDSEGACRAWPGLQGPSDRATRRAPSGPSAAGA